MYILDVQFRIYVRFLAFLGFREEEFCSRYALEPENGSAVFEGMYVCASSLSG